MIRSKGKGPAKRFRSEEEDTTTIGEEKGTAGSNRPHKKSKSSSKAPPLSDAMIMDEEEEMEQLQVADDSGANDDIIMVYYAHKMAGQLKLTTAQEKKVTTELKEMVTKVMKKKESLVDFNFLFSDRWYTPKSPKPTSDVLVFLDTLEEHLLPKLQLVKNILDIRDHGV